MSDRLKKNLLWGVACPLFTIFSIVFGIYWTFPYDHLRDFIVQEAERGGGLQLEITSLEPSWLTGVHAEGVSVAMIDEDDEGPASEVVIREADARVSLLSLMGGTTDVSFDLEMDGGGTIEGNFAESEEQTHIDAHIERVDLRRVGPLRSAIGLPLFGRLGGDIDLNIGAEAVNTEGTVNLEVQNAALADGQTPLEIPGLGTGLTLERLNLGTLQFEMETERGNGSIETMHADGEHAELWGSGSIRLARPLSRSSIDMLFRINFEDAYKTSTPRMEGLFALLEMNPQVRPARTPGGALQWRIQGSFAGRVRMVPSGRVPMPSVDD